MALVADDLVENALGLARMGPIGVFAAASSAVGGVGALVILRKSAGAATCYVGDISGRLWLIAAGTAVLLIGLAHLANVGECRSQGAATILSFGCAAHAVKTWLLGLDACDGSHAGALCQCAERESGQTGCEAAAPRLRFSSACKICSPAVRERPSLLP